MKPTNHTTIRQQQRIYYAFCVATFIFIAFCLYMSLKTANYGVADLEKKNRAYNNIKVKQGEMNLEIDEILVQINDLRFKERSLNERKYLQSLINEKRFKINNEIQNSKTDLTNSFVLYDEFLKEIQQIQTKIDVLKEADGVFEINKDQLEKCIKKHDEEINKPKTATNGKSN